MVRGLGVRFATAATFVLGVVAVALVMFGSAGDYRVDLTLDNAGQLVRGNHVKVGGVPVGEVTAIDLARDGRARIEIEITDDGLAPLPRGTQATVRSTSLAGIANRYVSLALGPNDSGEIPDGGSIPADDGTAAVDLDQVLNSIEPATQASLRAGVRASGRIFRDERTAAELNAALEALNPALSQSARTAAELGRDRRALARFVVEGADAATAIASRPDDLEQVVGQALAAASQLADESEALERTIGRLPPLLRRTNTTLVNLRPALGDLRVAALEARPSVRYLDDLLDGLLTRVGGRALGEVAALRRLIDSRGERDLLAVLAELPRLARTAVPTLDAGVSVTRELIPIARDVRPYTPDVVGGIIHGLGGSTAGYYDANGHYTRISALFGPGSINDLPLLPEGGAAGYRTDRLRRCPGAAIQPHRDGSNPFLDGRDDFPCEPGKAP